MQNRNYGLDIFRIMCCLGVLDYHIVGAYLNGTNVCSGGGAQALYFLAAFCVPGFFLLSGYLLGQKNELDIGYYEKKITQIISKLLGWVVFWTVVHFMKTEEVYDVWGNFTASVSSEGILPVAWFLFTYCFLMIIGYLIIQLKRKRRLLFHVIVIVWMCALAMGAGRGIMETRRQSLWLHLYIGYFGLGIALEQWIGGGKLCWINCHRFVLLGANLFLCAVYLFHVLTAKEYLPPNAYYGKWYYTFWLISLFWFVSTVEIKNGTIKKLISRVSSNALVVYLAPHIPTLYVLSIVHLDNIGQAVALILVLFIGAVILAEIFRKMPLLRKIV